MGLPCPFEDIPDSFDFSHVLDFCCQLEIISITPTKVRETDFNMKKLPTPRSNELGVMCNTSLRMLPFPNDNPLMKTDIQ